MQAKNSARECRLALEDLDPMADAVNMARAQGALSAYRDLASDDFPDQLMTALAESLPKEN